MSEQQLDYSLACLLVEMSEDLLVGTLVEMLEDLLVGPLVDWLKRWFICGSIGGLHRWQVRWKVSGVICSLLPPREGVRSREKDDEKREIKQGAKEHAGNKTECIV